MHTQQKHLSTMIISLTLVQTGAANGGQKKPNFKNSAMEQAFRHFEMPSQLRKLHRFSIVTYETEKKPWPSLSFLLKYLHDDFHSACKFGKHYSALLGLKWNRCFRWCLADKRSLTSRSFKCQRQEKKKKKEITVWPDHKGCKTRGGGACNKAEIKRKTWIIWIEGLITNVLVLPSFSCN